MTTRQRTIHESRLGAKAPGPFGESVMTTTFVREISLRYRGQRRGEGFNPIVAPDEAHRFIRRILPDNVREHFLALFLDGKNHVTGFYIVATGSAASCPVAPRELFQGAIVAGALSLVVAHNHPSGSVEPSVADRDMTKRLWEAGKLLGIPVLDHIIVGADGFYSFNTRGEMPSA